MCLAAQIIAPSVSHPCYVSSNSVIFMQHWNKLVIQGVSCPVGRSRHAAVCLGYGGDSPQLLVTGGREGHSSVLNDVWLLDLKSGRWREVRVDECERLSKCKLATFY